MATTSSPTHRVFQTKVRKAVSRSRYRTWSGVAARLKKNGLFDGLYRSRFCLNAVTRLHRNGAAQIRADRAAAR
jgi:hypothetical protein